MRLRLVAAALACVGAFQANALLLTPENTIPGPEYGPKNCEPGCIYSEFETSGLALLYKAEAGSTVLEDGLFKDVYKTEFLNSPTDPSGAKITNTSPLTAWIVCGACYLAIKDGQASPGYYFYNLSGWNGKETIELASFWPQQGAISHVAIWGNRQPVPEPGTLSLLGAGLLLAAFGSRRKLAR